jgi:nickel-type superoxide dismutase maturation protease
MQPTLSPRDHVLVCRWSKVRAGDIVVFRDPEAQSRFLVKRVVGVESASVTVRGDNPNVSRDSREFGQVSRGLVIGRVVYRRARH